MTKVKKLLIILPDGFPNPWPAVVDLFGRYLPTYGVMSDLVTVRSEFSVGNETWPAGRLFLAPQSHNIILGHVLEFQNELRALWKMKRGEYQGIQVRDKAIMAVFAILQARRLGIPFFYWMSYPVHSSVARMAMSRGTGIGMIRRIYLLVRGIIGGFILKLVVPHASQVFVLSEKMAELVLSWGVPAERITVFPVGIDPENFPDTPVTPAWDADLENKRIIGYVGACDRLRNIDFLLDIVTELRVTIPNVLLLIIGDAREEADRQWLRDQIEKRNLAGAVFITGWIPRREVRSWLCLAEVALAYVARGPLFDVSSPIKILEYMAEGKAIVANDNPDQVNLLNESGAGLCCATETKAYANGIQTLLEDTILACEMAQRGRPYVMRVRSYPKMAGRLSTTYHQLMASPRSDQSAPRLVD